MPTFDLEFGIIQVEVAEPIFGSVNVDVAVGIPGPSGSGDGGAVDSVNGQTGVVVLTAANVGADATGTAATAVAALSTVYQPLDSDLTAIAALTTTSYGRAFLALADAAAGRTALGLGTAATQATGAFDAAGAAAAAQAASQPLDSDLTAIAALTTTSYGRAFLALADAAAGRTALGLGTAATTASSAYDAAGAAAAVISDTAYAASWDAVTTIAPSKNAVYDQLQLLAPLASPTLTGTPAAPTAAAATNTTQIATTAFVTTADNLKANLASPTFTGTPAAPTPSAADNSTKLATTAYVDTADNLKANLASPTFTGTPAAPTASAATNTTQLATTAHVFAERTNTATLTNKRVTKRILAHASNATPTINTDSYDGCDLTLATAVTSMTTNLTGTPVNGDTFMFKIISDSTPRAITWGTSFQSSGVATLLATTAASKTHHVGLRYDGTKWTCLAVDSTGY